MLNPNMGGWEAFGKTLLAFAYVARKRSARAEYFLLFLYSATTSLVIGIILEVLDFEPMWQAKVLLMVPICVACWFSAMTIDRLLVRWGEKLELEMDEREAEQD